MQYDQCEDRFFNIRNVPSQFERRTYYGRLLRLLAIDFAFDQGSAPETYLLALIRQADTSTDGYGISSYNRLGAIYAVDAKVIRNVVGRILVGRTWYIVDRAPNSFYPEFEDEEEDEGLL
jgi:hypothetical protein